MSEAPWGGSEELWAGTALAALAAGWQVQALLPGFKEPHPKRSALVQAGLELSSWTHDDLRNWNTAIASPTAGASSSASNPYRSLCNPRPDLLLISHGGLMDMVNAHGGMLSELWASGVPYVIVIQANTEGYWPTDTQRHFMRSYFCAAQQVVFVSRQNLEFARRQLADPIVNAIVWQQPVNLAALKAVKWPKEPVLNLASVARLDVLSKGQDLLLAVLSTPVWRERSWKLNFYGTGPSAGLLQESAAVGGIADRVQFHGQVPDVSQIWRTNHALVMPSRVEGTPLALLEALCCGRPALATDVGGSADWLIADQTGFVAEAPRLEPLAAALERMWQNRDALPGMGEAAARFIGQSFDPRPGESLLHYLEEHLRLRSKSSSIRESRPLLSIVRVVTAKAPASSAAAVDPTPAPETETITVYAGSSASRPADATMHVIATPLTNPAVAANAGLRAARGRHVLLVEDAQDVPGDYLLSVLAALRGAQAPEYLCAGPASGPGAVPALGVFPLQTWRSAGGYPAQSLAGYQEWFWQRLRTQGDRVETISRAVATRRRPVAAGPARVTVVVTCYNYARYLERSVDSVLAQDFDDFEIVIVNDGSTDTSPLVADWIAALHPGRIRVLHQANSGQPAISRNNGIAAARGEMILTLDADDWIAPTMLRECVALLEADPALGVAYTDTFYCHEFGQVQMHAAGEFSVAALRENNRLNCCSLYRRKVWTKVGGYRTNVRGYEDWDFWLAAAAAGFTGKRVAKPLFFYRAKGTGVYAETVADDKLRRARIKLNNPSCYPPAERAQAEALIAAEQKGRTGATVPATERPDPPRQAAPAPSAPRGLVSVVIPCYRQAEYLRDAVDSIIAQTYPKWEIIIVNDGSPDDTSAVAQAIILARPGHTIRLVEKKNGGLSDARNAGIRLAKGDYILPLDADDKIDPQFLAKTVALLEQHPDVGIAYTDWVYFGAHSAARDAIDYDFARLCSKENLFTCTSLYRKAAWEAAGGYNPNMTCGVEDWDFWIGCGEHGFQGRRIPEPLFFYRAKDRSMIHTLQPHLPAMFARIILNHPRLYNADAVRNAQKLFDSARLPLPKETSAGTEWLPSKPGPDEFMQLVTAAEELLLAGRTDEAIVRIEQALRGKPTPECAARAAEILGLLRATKTSATGTPPTGEVPASDDFFEADECKNIEELIATYVAQPVTHRADEPIRALQESLMAFLVTAETEKLEGLFRGNFGRVFRALLQSGLSRQTPSEAMQSRLAELVEAITKPANPTGVFDFRPLLALMLAAPAQRYAAAVPVEKIPAWLLADYRGQVLPAAEAAPSLTEFQQAIQTGEDLVRNGRFQEAQAQMALALKVAPNAECRTRAEEIISLIRDEAEGPVPAAVGGSEPSGNDFFGPAEITAINQLIAAYTTDPANAGTLTGIGSLRQGLADFLTGPEVRNLEALFSGDFGQVYRKVLNCGLLSEPATDAQRAAVRTMAAGLGLAEDGSGDLAFARLLALMLFAPAHQAAVPLALEKIPAWFLDGYLGYVLYAPPVFAVAGEAETYREHMLAWVRSIQHRVRTAPAEPLTLHVAHHFALKANYIPLYFTAANTRELAEKRAAIMEFVVAQRGGVLNASFARRSGEGRKIRVGYLNAHFSTQTETHVTLPCLHLDRSRFELILFPLTVTGGPLEDYCRSLTDKFVHLPPDLSQQVSVIRQAELDVIIIGTNVTAVTNQVALLALHRLAPLQLVSYCSPVSTGMRHVDGYLSGTFAAGDGVGDHFSEKLCLCEGPPGCLDYTVENRVPASRFDRESMGIAGSDVVFVNAAACFKILPEMQATWAKIIQAVDHSRLLLLPFNPNWHNNFPVKQFTRSLGAAFRRQGLGEDRIILSGSLPSRAEVKELEKIADVYLDTYPFSGSISVIDPLELGIPSVVWEGKTHRSRMAAALLRELAVPELIACDEKSYVEISVKLATDAPFRRLLKARILDGMERKPRFINPAAYGQQLGELLVRLVTGRTQPGAASGQKRPKTPVLPALVA